MTEKELEKLINPEIFNLIGKYHRINPSEFALKFSGEKELPVRAIAEQIELRKKAIRKFPELSDKDIIYEKKSFEQSSSEITAKFKHGLISGGKIIDLTGGMGIDAFYLAENFKEYHYCDIDNLTCKIFGYNLGIIGNSGNIEIHNADSIEKLKEFPGKYFDWIYVDPDRRAGGKRSVDLNYCSPDLPGNVDLFRAKSKKMMVKLSPAFDLTEAKRLFADLSQYIVVSVENECKEVLLIIDYEHPENDILITAAVLNGDEVKLIKSYQKEIPGRNVSAVMKYFFEPDPAIIKAGLTQSLAGQLKLSFVNNEVDFLTGETLQEDFSGRSFIIKTVLEFKPETVKKYLKENGIIKANIAKRAFPITVDEFRNKFKLKEGGEDYLFLTKNNRNELVIVFCLKSSGL